MKKKQKLMMIFFIVIIAVVFTFWLYKNIFFPRKYSDYVEQACSIYTVDPNLVYAIIKQESKFNKNAESASGAKGLMQVLDSTAKDMVRSIGSINSKDYDIYDPYTNIFIGTKYLSYLINYYDGNYYLAVAAYNAGLGKVDNWIKANNLSKRIANLDELLNILEYDETKYYVINVLNYYQTYINLYGNN